MCVDISLGEGTEKEIIYRLSKTVMFLMSGKTTENVQTKQRTSSVKWELRSNTSSNTQTCSRLSYGHEGKTKGKRLKNRSQVSQQF